MQSKDYSEAVRKLINYVARADKSDREKTRQKAREIRKLIRVLEEKSRQRVGGEATRLAQQAMELHAELDAALGGATDAWLLSPPDPRACL